jgi:hypothetical protein
MDAHTFDRFVATVASRPSRRAALRLIAGGLLGVVWTRGGVAPTRAAQRPDRDGDGLFDDDETDVYGTNPDNPDSDGDGIDDGQEVFDGTDPLTPNGGAQPPADGGVCADCIGTEGPMAGDIPGAEATCSGPGLALCPGGCTDIRSDPANCGVCGWVCAAGDICQGGLCTLASCPAGTTQCGLVCINTSYDVGNCGACGTACAEGLVCCDSSCVDISSDPNNCGQCNTHCFTPLIGDATCVNYQCNG